MEAREKMVYQFMLAVAGSDRLRVMAHEVGIDFSEAALNEAEDLADEYIARFRDATRSE